MTINHLINEPLGRRGRRTHHGSDRAVRNCPGGRQAREREHAHVSDASYIGHARVSMEIEKAGEAGACFKLARALEYEAQRLLKI